MLMELRDNVSRLDAQAYAELKSYKEPPPVVHQIIKAVLPIFYNLHPPLYLMYPSPPHTSLL